jgi:thiol-disulfide isomerase/thioredoxin
VYHSAAPLPSASAPRADGKPTLVWFSGTWCEYCEQMDSFAHETANGFAARMVFVEKSVDDDRSAASRYGIRGTPTFVLIDARGKELGRFGFQSSSAAFAQTIEAVLKRAT